MMNQQTRLSGEYRAALHEEFRDAINRLCIENDSDTPDYILAEIAVAAIVAFTNGVNERRDHKATK